MITYLGYSGFFEGVFSIGCLISNPTCFHPKSFKLFWNNFLWGFTYLFGFM